MEYQLTELIENATIENVFKSWCYMRLSNIYKNKILFSLTFTPQMNETISSILNSYSMREVDEFLCKKFITNLSGIHYMY